MRNAIPYGLKTIRRFFTPWWGVLCPQLNSRLRKFKGKDHGDGRWVIGLAHVILQTPSVTCMKCKARVQNCSCRIPDLHPDVAKMLLSMSFSTLHGACSENLREIHADSKCSFSWSDVVGGNIYAWSGGKSSIDPFVFCSEKMVLRPKKFIRVRGARCVSSEVIKLSESGCACLRALMVTGALEIHISKRWSCCCNCQHAYKVV